MELYLTLSAVWNIIAGLASLSIIAYLVIFYWQRVLGMIFPFAVSFIVVLYFVWFYGCILMGYFSQDMGSILLRPFNGILIIVPGVFAISQLARIFFQEQDKPKP